VNANIAFNIQGHTDESVRTRPRDGLGVAFWDQFLRNYLHRLDCYSFARPSFADRESNSWSDSTGSNSSCTIAFSATDCQTSAANGVVEI
jgi:hypothetical protein